MEPEFSREAVATFIAATIGSILDLDSVRDVPETHPPSPRSSGEQEVPASFAPLVEHLDFRTEQLVGTDLTPQFFEELSRIRWMPHETLRYQSLVETDADRPN